MRHCDHFKQLCQQINMPVLAIREGSHRKTNIQPCQMQSVFLQQSLENNRMYISHNTLHVVTCTIKCMCLFLLYFDTKNIKGFRSAY
jgi:hypothetical protein